MLRRTRWILDRTSDKLFLEKIRTSRVWISLKTIWSYCTLINIKKCLYLEFFWSIFSCIQAIYREIQSFSPYSIRMRENMNKKKTPNTSTLYAVIIGRGVFRNLSKIYDGAFCENNCLLITVLRVSVWQKIATSAFLCLYKDRESILHHGSVGRI